MQKKILNFGIKPNKEAKNYSHKQKHHSGLKVTIHHAVL